MMRAALVLLALAPVWAQTTAGPVTPIVSGGTVKVTGGTPVVSQGTSIVSGGTTVIGGGGGVGPSTYTFVAYTFVLETAASSASTTSPALTLSTGDFVIWFCRNSGGPNTVSGSSTPANTVANLPQVNWNGGNAQAYFSYILSAIAGSTTFTCSYASAATFRAMVVLQYHHSGAAATFDTQVVNPFLATTTPTSSAFSTTGSPGLVIMCATWATQAQVTAGVIGGTAATLRGVTNTPITATLVDAGCDDASFASPQTGITASIVSGASTVGAYSVGVFK